MAEQRERHTDDRHYQFRADKELDAQIQQVWDPSLTATKNITRIVLAGVMFLQPITNKEK